MIWWKSAKNGQKSVKISSDQYKMAKICPKWQNYAQNGKNF
jgi:hypothetical protein